MGVRSLHAEPIPKCGFNLVLHEGKGEGLQENYKRGRLSANRCHGQNVSIFLSKRESVARGRRPFKQKRGLIMFFVDPLLLHIFPFFLLLPQSPASRPKRKMRLLLRTEQPNTPGATEFTPFPIKKSSPFSPLSKARRNKKLSIPARSSDEI